MNVDRNLDESLVPSHQAGAERAAESAEESQRLFDRVWQLRGTSAHPICPAHQSGNVAGLTDWQASDIRSCRSIPSKSRMRSFFKSGSARGADGNGRPYRDG